MTFAEAKASGLMDDLPAMVTNAMKWEMGDDQTLEEFSKTSEAALKRVPNLGHKGRKHLARWFTRLEYGGESAVALQALQERILVLEKKNSELERKLAKLAKILNGAP